MLKRKKEKKNIVSTEITLKKYPLQSFFSAYNYNKPHIKRDEKVILICNFKIKVDLKSENTT